jgi:cell division protease FtsH
VAAATMVGSLGLGGSLISYEAADLAGAGNVVAKVLAHEDGRERVSGLLDAAKSEVTALLDHNRHLVEALRDALLERQELIGSEITEVLVEATAAADSPFTIDLG